MSQAALPESGSLQQQSHRKPPIQKKMTLMTYFLPLVFDRMSGFVHGDSGCVCVCVCEYLVVCLCVCVSALPHHSHYTTPDAVQDLWQVQWSSAVVLSFYIHTISFRQRLLQRTTWLVLYVSIFYFEATG